MGTLEEVGNVYDSETWNEIRNKLHAMSELENRGKCYREYAEGESGSCGIGGWGYAVAEFGEYGKGNREYASDVFAMLMEDGEYRLDVYNALNGTDYRDPKLVEVITLESGVSLSVRNDASFLIGGDANFYEHQSTRSPNLPLRFLIYFSHFMKVWIEMSRADVFSKGIVKIPTPHFVVFYNGKEERPEKEEMRLSAAFSSPVKEGEEPDLEVRCVVYNINSGKNGKLLGKSETLSGYMYFVNRVRENLKGGMTMEKAIDNAIQDCIRDDMLKRFFEARKDEIRKSMMWDFTMERHMELMREEERQEGRQEGIIEGKTMGRQEGRTMELLKLVQRKVKKGKQFCVIKEELEAEEQELKPIYDQVIKHGADCDPEELLKAILGNGKGGI